MIKISKIEEGAKGDLTFQTEQFFAGKAYQFKGILNSEVLSGDLKIIGEKNEKSNGQWKITANKIQESKTAVNSKLQLPIKFSNVDYSNEGGDATGVDIRIFSTRNGLAGLVFFYESLWGETTYTPLAFSKVTLEKKTVRFETKTSKGNTGYHIRLIPTGARFNRDDISHQNGDSDIALKKGSAF
jgi:hypothetical protein